MDTSKKVTIGVIILLVAVAIGFGIFGSAKAGKYDEFAQCLSNSGAKFYGAFWCPHCQKEKALFGSSKQYLPYVECSTPDGKNQTQACIDEKIEGYPTWTFATPIVVTVATDPTELPPDNGSEFSQWIFTTETGDSFRIISTTKPTVIEADGKKTYTFDSATSRASGETSLEFLSSQTSCPLPQE